MEIGGKISTVDRYSVLCLSSLVRRGTWIGLTAIFSKFLRREKIHWIYVEL